MNAPRLLQTYLLDGTLEGVQIIDCESTVKAFVIPRLKLSDVKDREELSWPALYFLINSENNQAYVGESENFYQRIRNHDQNKDWWDIVVAIVSTTNELEKSDVKYLESLAVERAQGGSMHIENRVSPVRNNIHEFKLHKLQKVLDDTQFMLTSLGYDTLSSPAQKNEQVWICKSKKTLARAVFKGGQFVVLTGSVMDREPGKGWANYPDQERTERQDLLNTYGRDNHDVVMLGANISFKSPNHAGRILLGRSANAWTTWKNEQGQTMDEVMRRSEA